MHPAARPANTGFQNYLEVSRYLPPSLTGKLSDFNWTTSGALRTATTSGPSASSAATRREVRWARRRRGVGAGARRRDSHGPAHQDPGINEGSSGYETVVRSSIIKDDPTTSTADPHRRHEVGLVRDIEVGDFLDRVYFDPDNTFARTAAAPHLQHAAARIDRQQLDCRPAAAESSAAALPGRPDHTAVIFNQADLTQAPFIIEGNEVYPIDGFERYDDGSGIIPPAAPARRTASSSSTRRPT